MPSILGYLCTAGAVDAGYGTAALTTVGFALGAAHPMYAALAPYAARIDAPYAWYVRVPDVPGFIRHVAPVLEARLAQSARAGHTGEVCISFYRDGLRLAFDQGRLSAVASWQQPRGLAGVERGQETRAPRADAMFPDLTFLQLLFGHRSVEELEYAFADCLVRTEATRALLDALFPKHPSHVFAVL